MPDVGRHIFNRPYGLVAIAAYKFLWGFSEVLVGSALCFFTKLVSGELAEDPQDSLANWFLVHVHMSPTTSVHLGILFIIFGCTKIAISFGIWYRSKRLRDILMVFLAIVTLYGAYDLIHAVSALKIFTLFMDVIVLLYLWKILPHHLKDKGVDEPIVLA